MEQFIKQLSKRLSDVGYLIKQEGGSCIYADGVCLRADWIEEDGQGRERVLFQEARFMIRDNGNIPNIDKAVGLAVAKISRVKRNRRINNQSKGKDATILMQPGGFTLTIRFDDQLSASAALDMLMEYGFVAPAIDKQE